MSPSHIKDDPGKLMASYLHSDHDLVTPDGVMVSIQHINEKTAIANVIIENIPDIFVGFQIDPQLVFFNIKSTLAQLGLNGIGMEYELNVKNHSAQIKVQLTAIGKIAETMLKLLPLGAYIGKLFAADDRRRVRDPDYLSRYFGRADRRGRPLLSLGGLSGSNDLIVDKVDGRAVAYLTLQNGRVRYDESIYGFLPTLAKALKAKVETRNLLKLHQQWINNLPRKIDEDEILLLKTLPLHIRTVFGRVVDNLLSQGYKHTSASVLQPDTTASGDIYELYGKSDREISDIPLEFYTLEPYREYVFYADRDQLQLSVEDPAVLFKAFDTAPKTEGIADHDSRFYHGTSVFVVKGTQLLGLKPEDWIVRESRLQEFPGLFQGSRQALMVERYIKQQSSYPFLKAIDDGDITSQGVLLTRYFPSPLMKRMLLGDHVQRLLKGIYFEQPSQSYQDFFSAEDQALLHDLEKFAIPVYWVDRESKQILQYIQKPGQDSGLFVPLSKVDTFIKSTVFGIYGSNLLEGNFETELKQLLGGVLAMRAEMTHPRLNRNTPLALVTGGGPGMMLVGNRVAKEMGVLSCANIVDFRPHDGSIIPEQHQNPYIEAKMTYRLEKLVERQAEFNLDFPIFLTGGIGTDFEYSLEEVRRKIGAKSAAPILLFGDAEYWSQKITSRFKCNLESGTIKGSEWVSNCFYCVQTAAQGLNIYREFFKGTLPIGPHGPIYDDGFVKVPPIA